MKQASENEAKKQAMFKKVRSWKQRKLVSIDIMKEYVQAVNDYANWIHTVFIDVSLSKYKCCILTTMDIRDLPDSDVNLLKDQKELKVKEYKERLENSGWYPPIIYDQHVGKLLDGHHRAEALRQLGYTRIKVFKCIKK